MMIDEDVSRLLHDAAGRIPVLSQLDAVLADTVVVTVVRTGEAPPRAPRRLLPPAVAACLVAAAAVGALVVARDDGRPLFAGPPAPVPAGAPVPGTVAPFIPSPPAWVVGRVGEARRHEPQRSGRWVRAAFGVVDGDVVRRPITVAAFDGRFVPGGDATAVEVEIDGTAYRSLRYGSWQALFTIGRPAIMVTGLVAGPDDGHLASVAALAHAAYDEGRLTLTLDRAPAGYSLVVPPQALAEDTRNRPALSNSASFGINDVSDQVDPLLDAAGAGVDLRAVHVGGVTGWYYRVDDDHGRLTALSWSPRPGVVFELVTTDPDRSPQQLAAVAADTEVVPVDEWAARLRASAR